MSLGWHILKNEILLHQIYTRVLMGFFAIALALQQLLTFWNVSFSVFSLVLVSIDKIYQRVEMVFDQISSTILPCALSSICVWKCGFQACYFHELFCAFLFQESLFSWQHNNEYIIAVFNDMQTLKFKAQLRIGFFPAVNQNYGDSQRTLKHKKTKMDRNLLIMTSRRGLLTQLK